MATLAVLRRKRNKLANKLGRLDQATAECHTAVLGRGCDLNNLLLDQLYGASKQQTIGAVIKYLDRLCHEDKIIVAEMAHQTLLRITLERRLDELDREIEGANPNRTN